MLILKSTFLAKVPVVTAAVPDGRETTMPTAPEARRATAPP
jgi:hypothetical protein